MAAKRLAEMDFDEFVDNALESESVGSTDTSEHSPEHKPTSKAQRHKAVLLNLAEDDPEFYNYLLENDKQLLDFELSDELSVSDGTGSVSGEGAGETESESHSESESETSKPIDSDLSDAGDDESEIITKKQVTFLARALSTKNSISAFRQASSLFHTAVHQVAGDISQDTSKLRFEKVTTFNELVACCLLNIPTFLQRQLVCSNDVIVIRGKNCRKSWSKIREIAKQYLADLLYTMDKLDESSLLRSVLISTKPLISLFQEFRGLRKKYIKILIKLWTKDDRSVQLQSFLCMKASILFSNNALFNYLLKRSYLSFVQATKYSSELNREYIAFLTDSLVEIHSVDLSRAYQLAFVYIRQLAIHLRNALTAKTDETTLLVYNWQFVLSIDFWCKLLSVDGAVDTNLKQLIFPLVQVALGAISLNPIAKFYPLRFRCVRSLNFLSLHTNTYIPLSNYLLDTMDYVRGVSKFAHLPPNPPNFVYSIKASKQFLKTKHFLDFTVEMAFELLLEHLSAYEHSIAFPEMSFPVIRELKKFAKATYNSKHRREIKSLTEKAELQAAFIEESRASVDFAPKDTVKVREWEASSATGQSYLSGYLALWRRSNDRSAELNADTCSGSGKEEKGRKSRRKKVSKARGEIAPNEQGNSSNSESGTHIRMKRRASVNRNNLKDKKPSKGHTPQKGKQQTLTDFFKQNNSDTQTGKKRFTNSVRTFSKVIVIDEDCESNSGVKSNNKDKRVFYNATEIQAGSSLDIPSEQIPELHCDLPVLDDITDPIIANASTPYSPGYSALNCGVKCQRELFSSADLSPVAENAAPEESIMSNLSELFDDITSAFVDKQIEDDLELPAGVYKYTVSHYETTSCSHPLRNIYVGAKKMKLKSIDNPARDAICFLMEDWFPTEIIVNTRINIILSETQKYPFNPLTNSLTICLDTDSNSVFIITHPDSLLSGTVVAGSFFCERKTILNELIRSQETELAKHALIGTILHDIFQQAMVTNKFDLESLEQTSRNVPTNISYLESLALLELSAADVLESVNRHLSNFSQFGDRFMRPQPLFPSGKIDIPWRGDACSETSIAVTEVLDIEESIWSPRYGLKGKIDASIAVKIRKRSSDKPDSTHELRIPFELKSGKMAFSKGSIEHRAQVMLYTLMMGERLREGIPFGLLFYSQTGHLQGITASYQELKGILMRRNELASYLYSISSTAAPNFPPVLKVPRVCSKCSQLNACMLIHQNIENGDEVSSGLGNEFSKIVGQLTDSEKLYFSHWFNMIQLESKMQCNDNKVSEIWTKSSQERESLGNCYGHLIIESVSISAHQGNEVTLIRNTSVDRISELRDNNISVGDSLIVSYEDLSQLCIAWSTVTHLSSSHIVINTGSVDMSKHKVDKSGRVIELRLDKCENYRPSAIVLMNLMEFFQQNERSAKLRHLIIHRAPPCYATDNTVSAKTLEMYSDLNSEQQHTIEKILASSDYTIVQGMPGTGKTTLISSLIHVLISQQQTVLLSSYTNTALDNILLKLIEIGVEFVRIGKDSSVHPSVVRFLPQTCLKETNTIKGVADFYNNKKLYAATCLSINNVFIQKTEFDWCIVDEASQLTQFLCLGPILRAKRFLLVGDIHQLPPLVRSSEAKKQGYDVSLFRKLSEDHPHSVLTLISQYRMNASIMSIANQLIYQRKMHCADEKVSEGKLHIPNWGLGVSIERWIKDCISPDRPVVFINTDLLESREMELNQRVCNQLEVKIIQNISDALTKLGILGSQIGIITPYRQQVNLLCSAINQGLLEPIEISTVDKFQGRDKDCIIVSAVRNNTEGKIGELLPDKHRLNVMITRARHKLIIVGSVETLSHCEIFKQLIKLFKGRQWLVDLSKEQISFQFN